MSSITKFSNLYNNNTWTPKNSYVADGQHTLPVKYTREPHLTKNDASIKRMTEVLENSRKYDEKHSYKSNRYNNPSYHSGHVAALGAIAAGVPVPPQLLEYFRELRDLHDLSVWVNMMRGVGGSIKKHKKEKIRKPTKRRRPTKKRRPTKRRR